MAEPSHPEPESCDVPGRLPELGLLDLGFLTEGAGETQAGAMLGERAGEMIGRYRLLELLGEGGFGHVWKVEQSRPFHRFLALKLIKPGMDSREILVRFAGERQALARMDHPNIATVLDAGATPAGRPYFAMEYVNGVPVTCYCEDRRLGLTERLRLFIAICGAVQHAHVKGVLHRDLKPSNVLVGEVDGRPVPKVIDFGIAKALGSATDETVGASHLGSLLYTQSGTIIGTPQYMSPEQAGSMADVDTRSDVYSLGVILCEFLTGCSPFPGQPTGLTDTLRWIRETEAARPSQLVLDPAIGSTNHGGMERSRLSRLLKGDLDWIVLKALEKDRARRYETAAALAEDVQRHLDQLPVHAVAPTWQYQLGKFTRRHRAALISSILIAAALLAGTAASLWQAAQAEESRAEAEGNFQRARSAVDHYLNEVTDHARLKEADFTDLQRNLLETALPFYLEMSKSPKGDVRLDSNRAAALWRLGTIYQRIGELEKAEPFILEAIEIETHRFKQQPDDPVLQSGLALRYGTLGVIREMRGLYEESIADQIKAEEFYEMLLRKTPDHPAYLNGLCIVLGNRTNAVLFTGRHAEGLPLMLRAVDIAENLTTRFPENPKYRLQLAVCQTRLGATYHTLNRNQEAEPLFRRSAVLLQDILRTEPANREGQRQLAASVYHLGVTLCMLDRMEEGITQIRRSVGLQQKLCDEFPSIAKYRENQVIRLEYLADMLERVGQDEEAFRLAGQAGWMLVDLNSRFPKTPQYRELGASVEAVLNKLHKKGKATPMVKGNALMLPATPGTGPLRQPTKFKFDYHGTDPGPRIWTKTPDGWTETQPSGVQNRYLIVGPKKVDGVSGVEIRRDGVNNLRIFIPDMNVMQTPCIWMHADGVWQIIGGITGME
ncbi:serine/threonine-protein kinase [Verrucomicrobium sp. BvORR106]|uniref:serine/threonine-protein kinase n=1 Tax=Verrucomicrobium sp. BvORR106 TaxID=1403819 RepID=UPI00068CE93D|nr:serine/threonine-protein kinase [Verrucomicrobium sp. BvORR106]